MDNSFDSIDLVSSGRDYVTPHSWEFARKAVGRSSPERHCQQGREVGYTPGVRIDICKTVREP